MNVIWWNAARGNWDSGLLCSIFDNHPETFIQHNSNELIYPKRAIVIVVGRPEVQPLYDYLKTLESGLVILTSEEDAYFDWKAAIPPHLEIWTQYYSTSKEGIKTRLLLGAPNRIKDYKINLGLPKKYLWSFVGQVQNPSRQACVEVLKGLPDGFLHIVPQFGGGEGGIEYQEYLDILCQSKFVICPSGSMSVDSFRLYEAIECGAIPITEKRAPRDKSDFNYWNEVHPEHDILTVDNLNELPSIINNDWYTNNQFWWAVYKSDLEMKLIDYANSI